VGRFGSGPLLMGRIGSGVRVSVSFLQKCPPGSILRCPTAVENGSYDQWGCVGGGGLTSSPAYNVEPVTNTSSSSCANNGCRGVLDARRRHRRPRLCIASRGKNLECWSDTQVNSWDAAFMFSLSVPFWWQCSKLQLQTVQFSLGCRASSLASIVFAPRCDA